MALFTPTAAMQAFFNAATYAAAKALLAIAPSDLTQQGATLNQVIQWNGSGWVPADPPAGSLSFQQIQAIASFRI